jgi:hypothetical protein
VRVIEGVSLILTGHELDRHRDGATTHRRVSPSFQPRR